MIEQIKIECDKILELIPQKHNKAVKSHPWLLPKLIELYGNRPINELLYLGGNPLARQKCELNKPLKFIDKNAGYKRFCAVSKSCSCYIEFAKNNRLEKYKEFSEEKKKNRLEKFRQTNLEKYGVDNPTKNTEIKNRQKETAQEKYGVECILLLPENQLSKNSVEANNKRKNTLVEKYGVTHQQYITLGKDIEDILKNKEKLKKIIIDNDKNTTKIIKFLNLDRTSFLSHFYKHELNLEISLNKMSYPEVIIKDFLEENNIIFSQNNRKIISPLELDFYLPDYKLGIELHGLYWHSEKQKPDIKYHKNKFNLAEQNGINLLQFWENEIRDNFSVIEKMLKYKLKLQKSKIGARKVTLSEISPKLANEFLNQNHIQGKTPQQGIRIGAWNNLELVGVMTFQPKKDGYELTRFSINQPVPGLFSKMIKHFAIKYNPKWIKSFSDNRISNGNVYLKNGFTFSKELPVTYYYTDYQNVYHRFNFRRKLIEKKFGLDLTNHTEKSAMIELGFDRIWDAGKKEWCITF